MEKHTATHFKKDLRRKRSIPVDKRFQRLTSSGPLSSRLRSGPTPGSRFTGEVRAKIHLPDYRDDHEAVWNGGRGASNKPAPLFLTPSAYFLHPEHEAQHTSDGQQSAFAALAAPARPSAMTAINSAAFSFLMIFLLCLWKWLLFDG